MSWFSQQWNRFTGQEDEYNPNTPIRRVEVIWGRERLSIPVEERGPGQATLRQLKEEISRQTSVPYDQIKLILGGLILKDDRAPLASYHVRDGTRLTLVGTAGGVPVRGDMPGAKSSHFDAGKAPGSGGAPRRAKPREEDDSDASLLRRIDEAVAGVRKDLVPDVLRFEQAQQQQSKAAPPQPSTPQPSSNEHDRLAKQHRTLSELLLRVLLTLDGINVQSDDTRQRRKAAVKEVQGYLDRVDSTWSALKTANGQPQ